jgi:hypothetical protein
MQTNARSETHVFLIPFVKITIYGTLELDHIAQQKVYMWTYLPLELLCFWTLSTILFLF